MASPAPDLAYALAATEYTGLAVAVARDGQRAVAYTVEGREIRRIFPRGTGCPRWKLPYNVRRPRVFAAISEDAFILVAGGLHDEMATATLFDARHEGESAFSPLRWAKDAGAGQGLSHGEVFVTDPGNHVILVLVDVEELTFLVDLEARLLRRSPRIARGAPPTVAVSGRTCRVGPPPFLSTFLALPPHITGEVRGAAGRVTLVPEFVRVRAQFYLGGRESVLDGGSKPRLVRPSLLGEPRTPDLTLQIPLGGYGYDVARRVGAIYFGGTIYAVDHASLVAIDPASGNIVRKWPFKESPAVREAYGGSSDFTLARAYAVDGERLLLATTTESGGALFLFDPTDVEAPLRFIVPSRQGGTFDGSGLTEIGVVAGGAAEERYLFGETDGAVLVHADDFVMVPVGVRVDLAAKRFARVNVTRKGNGYQLEEGASLDPLPRRVTGQFARYGMSADPAPRAIREGDDVVVTLEGDKRPVARIAGIFTGVPPRDGTHSSPDALAGDGILVVRSEEAPDAVRLDFVFALRLPAPLTIHLAEPTPRLVAPKRPPPPVVKPKAAPKRYIVERIASFDVADVLFGALLVDGGAIVLSKKWIHRLDQNGVEIAKGASSGDPVIAAARAKLGYSPFRFLHPLPNGGAILLVGDVPGELVQWSPLSGDPRGPWGWTSLGQFSATMAAQRYEPPRPGSPETASREVWLGVDPRLPPGDTSFIRIALPPGAPPTARFVPGRVTADGGCDVMLDGVFVPIAPAHPPDVTTNGAFERNAQRARPDGGFDFTTPDLIVRVPRLPKEVERSVWVVYASPRGFLGTASNGRVGRVTFGYAAEMRAEHS